MFITSLHIEKITFGFICMHQCVYVYDATENKKHAPIIISPLKTNSLYYFRQEINEFKLKRLLYCCLNFGLGVDVRWVPLVHC